ncbi:hypothetical protein JTB14_032713 [Gonioctena quinquepunctata]|nr:hypothetical protein JTB14_032713 [Gonioctena quinquepunctata]
MDDFTQEEERLRNLFDSLDSDDDIILGDNSDDEEDHVFASEHETDSEAEEAESNNEGEYKDTFGDVDIPLSRRLDVFFGKDGTKWKKYPPVQNVTTRSVNIISHLPVVKQAAKNAKTPIDAPIVY